MRLSEVVGGLVWRNIGLAIRDAVGGLGVLSRLGGFGDMGYG